jgi:class 3 adenylate cyclase
MLDGRAVPRPRDWALPATGVLAVAGMTAGFALAGAAVAIVLTVLVLLAPVAACAAVAAGLPLVLPVAPALAALLAGGLVRAWRGHGERRDRRVLRLLFSRFVSAPVVDEILSQRELFLAGGRPRPQELTATVLFSDVAGFTTICEQLAPEPLIGWLDTYVDAMVRIVAGHDGVVLRFVGDGILSVFGAPVPRRDEAAIDADARNAARCALAMEAAMIRLNATWQAAGLPEAGLRIGIHTGRLVAGSFGNGPHMEFCLLGDTANVGARLEQLGKDHAEPLACAIMVGGPTWERLGGAFAGQRVGEVPLRGKQVRIAVWRIDASGQHSEPRQEALPPGSPPRAKPLEPIC